MLNTATHWTIHFPLGNRRQVALPLAKGRCGTGVCCCCALISLSTKSDSTQGATAVRGSCADPGPFTRIMRVPGVHLQLVLLWVLLWALVAQGARSVCPSCGVPTLAPQAERALVLELAKQQILEGLHLTSRPRIANPPPQAALARALRRLQQGSAAPTNGEEIISFATATGG